MESKTFTVRGSAEDVVALEKLKSVTGEATANRAIWKAVRGYPETKRLLVQCSNEVIRLREAWDDVERAIKLGERVAEERARAIEVCQAVFRLG